MKNFVVESGEFITTSGIYRMNDHPGREITLIYGDAVDVPSVPSSMLSPTAVIAVLTAISHIANVTSLEAPAISGSKPCRSVVSWRRDERLRRWLRY